MEIRQAKPSERRAIAAFCRREDPDDYVMEWMGRFQAAGKFYLLADGRRIAGIVHGRLAPDGSAWMSAARVGTGYRGQGWINRMNDFAFASPGLRGARAARMLITHDNASSIRAARKGGFRPVAALSFMEWEAPARKRAAPSGGHGFVRCTPSRFLRRARASRLLRQQGGLAYMSFNGAFALNGRSARASAPWLFDSPEHGPIMAALFPDTGERWMAVQPLASNGALARALAAFARERRVESMTVILPALERARRPFAAAGFSVSGWAERVLIFEKALPRRPASSRGRGAAAPKRRRP